MPEPLFTLKQREAIVASLGEVAGHAADFVLHLERINRVKNISYSDAAARQFAKLPNPPAIPQSLIRQGKRGDEMKDRALEGMTELRRKNMLDLIKGSTGSTYTRVEIKYNDKEGNPQIYQYDDGAEDPKTMSVDLTGFKLF